MKSKKNVKRGIGILLGLLVLCVGSGTASAQSFKGKFTLTDPVKWDQANLPAGGYTLTLATSPNGQPYGIVRSESGHLAVMVVPQLGESQESSTGSELTIQRDGDVGVVRSLFISDLGMFYKFSVSKKSGRSFEQVAKSTQRVKLTQSGR